MKRLRAPRVLFCGSRTWADFAAVEREVRALPPGTVVVHGGARGADRFAAMAARRHGYAVEEYRADWAAEGKAAGARRNARMLHASRPAAAVAFALDLRTSTGTKHMVKLLRAAGVPVRVLAE